MARIEAHHFHRADDKLKQIYEQNPSKPVLVMVNQANVDRESLERYIKFHLATFRQLLIANGVHADPRADIIFTTMMRQMFLAGAIAARDAEDVTA